MSQWAPSKKFLINCETAWVFAFSVFKPILPNLWQHWPKDQNKCSVGPETSISPRGKGQGQTSFSERGLFFSEIGQLSDRGKEQSSREKGRGWDLFYQGYTCFMPYRYIFSTSQTSWPQLKVYEIIIFKIWKPWEYGWQSKIIKFVFCRPA